MLPVADGLTALDEVELADVDVAIVEGSAL